jgi:hypothetical protein
MVGVRGIPIFGDRSRKFCFFFHLDDNRLLGQATVATALPLIALLP